MPTSDAYESLARSLTNQAPIDPVIVELFEDLRDPARAFGYSILQLVPASRERSLAITKLEEALMWAIKGIALNQEAIVNDGND